MRSFLWTTLCIYLPLSPLLTACTTCWLFFWGGFRFSSSTEQSSSRLMRRHRRRRRKPKASNMDRVRADTLWGCRTDWSLLILQSSWLLILFFSSRFCPFCPTCCCSLQSSSFSSITDSTMSLNIITVTLNMGKRTNRAAAAHRMKPGYLLSLNSTMPFTRWGKTCTRNPPLVMQDIIMFSVWFITDSRCVFLVSSQRSTTSWASVSWGKATREATEESTSAPSWREELWLQMDA